MLKTRKKSAGMRGFLGYANSSPYNVLEWVA